MKLGPVTKIDDVMSENFDVIVIFWILTNLKQSGGRIPETESANSIFSY